MTDEDKQWFSDQLKEGILAGESRFTEKLQREILASESRVTEKMQNEIHASEARLTEKIFDTETKLLTEFQKWASPVEMRARSHRATLRTLDAELERFPIA